MKRSISLFISKSFSQSFCALVPGAGVFWFSYYITTSQFELGLGSGFMALKVAVAIVLGIVFAMELPQRLFSRHRKATH